MASLLFNNQKSHFEHEAAPHDLKGPVVNQTRQKPTNLRLLCGAEEPGSKTCAFSDPQATSKINQIVRNSEVVPIYHHRAERNVPIRGFQQLQAQLEKKIPFSIAEQKQRVPLS
mmetsp:Transcript_4606/g.7274  ORF Transcript_4606/g.7274 Transcript_4606/m.7274 type:complete len:114 (-) Transcript_4606:772-1113(-)